MLLRRVWRLMTCSGTLFFAAGVTACSEWPAYVRASSPARGSAAVNRQRDDLFRDAAGLQPAVTVDRPES